MEELRVLVRKIAEGNGEEPVDDLKGAMFQPRDLLLLKLYAAGLRARG